MPTSGYAVTQAASYSAAKISKHCATSRRVIARAVMLGSMKVAAYQAPLLAFGSMDALDLIQDRIRWCESEEVSILCCPEAILGGLADFSEDPGRFAITITSGESGIASLLAPLASETVTRRAGFQL